MQNIWSLTGRSIAVSTLALALAACQSMRGPEPVAKPDIPNQFASQAATGTSVAEQGYKDYFSDPRLLQVIEMSLENNRDLRTAALNIQKAQLQYRVTELNQLPTVGTDVDYARGKTLSSSLKTVSTYQVGLGVTSYELDFWGRVRSLKDAALDTYLSTRAAKDSTQISLISQVAEAWVSYSYANANLKLAQQTLKAQQESYNLNKKRFDVGIDSEVPLRQSQISVETARSDVGNYQTQLEQAKNLLDVLVGKIVPNELLPTDTVKQITSQKVLAAGLPSDLLNNRPDIISAEYQLSSAGANIGAAKAAMFPTISLTASAGFASYQLSDLFKSGSTVWQFAPTLDLPIFDWGTRKTNVKISKVDQELYLTAYEKAIQTAFREVNDVLATRAHINERLAAQRSLVQATNKNYQLSTARFRAGIDNYLTVLDAQRSNYSAAQGLLTLEQTNLNNQIELYKTLGGGVKANTSDEVKYPASSAERNQKK